MPLTMVTGGLGFLGSHLVDRLLAYGHDVVVLDDGSSSVVAPDRYRLSCRLHLTDVICYRPEPSQTFDFIFHLAGVAGPSRIIGHAGTIGPTSLQVVDAVLRLAVPGRTKVLLVSSSEIYGRAGTYPESAEAIIYSPYTIRLEYAVSKSLSEITAVNYGQRVGLAVNVVRPFNIAGPRQSPVGGFVLPRFFDAALANAPLTVFGNGRQVRSFTHVLDTVESLIQVAVSAVSGEIFNSGNPDNVTTIMALAEEVKRICRSDSRIELVDPTTIFGPLYAESFDKVPNTEKIERMIGWRARRTLGDVLADMLADRLEPDPLARPPQPVHDAPNERT